MLKPKSNNSIIIIGLFGLLFSCEKPNQKSADKAFTKDQWNAMQVDEKTESVVNPRNPAKQTQDSLQEICNQYWTLQDSLHDIKLDFFRKEVLEPAEKSEDISPENRRFLSALQVWLTRAKTNDDLISSFPVLPVFNLTSGNPIVIENRQQSNPLHNQAMPQIAKNTNDQLATLNIRFPDLFDSVKAQLTGPFYAITTNLILEAGFSSFNFYQSECDEYFYWELTRDAFEATDRPLLMTPYRLDLEFQTAAEIDSLWRAQYEYQCYDCVFDFEPKRVFAKLRGVDNLYFTYSDTFPISKGINYPERAILMKIGNHLVNLWVEEVDLFGCSCL